MGCGVWKWSTGVWGRLRVRHASSDGGQVAPCCSTPQFYNPQFALGSRIAAPWALTGSGANRVSREPSRAGGSRANLVRPGVPARIRGKGRQHGAPPRSCSLPPPGPAPVTRAPTDQPHWDVGPNRPAFVSCTVAPFRSWDHYHLISERSFTPFFSRVSFSTTASSVSCDTGDGSEP